MKDLLLKRFNDYRKAFEEKLVEELKDLQEKKYEAYKDTNVIPFSSVVLKKVVGVLNKTHNSEFTIDEIRSIAEIDDNLPIDIRNVYSTITTRIAHEISFIQGSVE